MIFFFKTAAEKEQEKQGRIHPHYSIMTTPKHAQQNIENQTGLLIQESAACMLFPGSFLAQPTFVPRH